MESAQYESLLNEEEGALTPNPHPTRMVTFAAFLLGCVVIAAFVMSGSIAEDPNATAKFVLSPPAPPAAVLKSSDLEQPLQKKFEFPSPRTPIVAAKHPSQPLIHISTGDQKYSHLTPVKEGTPKISSASVEGNNSRLRVIFIRHAQSEANASGRIQGQINFSLSSKGREQAEALRKRLEAEGLEPSHVHTSPLIRARETAEIVSRNWNKTLDVWEELIEQNVGVFGGKTWEEIEKADPGLGSHCRKSRDWDQVPGAEKMHERVGRAHKVVERIIGEHSNGDVVVLFTHRAILQYILSEVLGTSRTWGFQIRNTAIFEFEINKDHWDAVRVPGTDGGESNQANNVSHFQIRRFNDASHLEVEPS